MSITMNTLIALQSFPKLKIHRNSYRLSWKSISRSLIFLLITIVSSAFRVPADLRWGLRPRQAQGGQWKHIQSFRNENKIEFSPRSFISFVQETRQQDLQRSDQVNENFLDNEQSDYITEFLNRQYETALVKFVLVFSKVGAEAARKNAFSGGSYRVTRAQIVARTIGFSTTSISIDATISIRNKPERTERVKIPLDAKPMLGDAEYIDLTSTTPHISSKSTVSKTPILDNWIRQMVRLCLIVKEPALTGRLVCLGIQIGGSSIGQLDKNLFLNQVPHNRYVRSYFYEMASLAVAEATRPEFRRNTRMKITCVFPEMNTQMDSYRIGTLLELIRTMALALATGDDPKKVCVCVQGSMGQGIFTGLPKSLSGVPQLLRRMDWQSEEGEMHEGILGRSIIFGGIGPDQIASTPDADVYLLICPQNMVGVESSILPYLEGMVKASEALPIPPSIVLINPDLYDKQSPQGQQGVRGRADRLRFINSFSEIYHFRCLYTSGTSYFPILGALLKQGDQTPWITLQRRDLKVGGDEIYVPVYCSENEPESEDINLFFK